MAKPSTLPRPNAAPSAPTAPQCATPHCTNVPTEHDYCAECNAKRRAPENVSMTGQTFQEQLGKVTPTREESTTDGDSNTVEFLSVVAELDTLIRKQTSSFVRYYADRGDKCRKALNIKLLKGRSKSGRDLLRSAGNKVLENTALGAYDPTVEAMPKIDRWVSLSVLRERYPNAENLSSVAAAEKLTVLFTRVDPPRSWDAPDEYELKRQYRGMEQSIGILIDTAVQQKWNSTQVSEGVDALNGAIAPEAIKGKDEVDPVKAARTLAISIMEKIIATTIDPETLFDELQAQLTRYGWALAKGHNANGAETLKPIKSGR